MVQVKNDNKKDYKMPELKKLGSLVHITKGAGTASRFDNCGRNPPESCGHKRN